MKIFIIVVSLFIAVVAQILLKKGMNEINGYDLTKIVTSLYISAGLSLCVVVFFMHLYIISKFNMGFIYPIMVGLIIILVLIASYLFLEEPITTKRILGILLIILGIIVIK